MYHSLLRSASSLQCGHQHLIAECCDRHDAFVVPLSSAVGEPAQKCMSLQCGHQHYIAHTKRSDHHHAFVVSLSSTVGEDNARALRLSRILVANFRTGTAAPTSTPTSAPTAMPTAQPTRVATPVPTARPTAKPVVAPTTRPQVRLYGCAACMLIVPSKCLICRSLLEEYPTTQKWMALRHMY